MRPTYMAAAYCSHVCLLVCGPVRLNAGPAFVGLQVASLLGAVLFFELATLRSLGCLLRALATLLTRVQA